MSTTRGPIYDYKLWSVSAGGRAPFLVCVAATCERNHHASVVPSTGRSKINTVVVAGESDDVAACLRSGLVGVKPNPLISIRRSGRPSTEDGCECGSAVAEIVGKFVNVAAQRTRVTRECGGTCRNSPFPLSN